jgi:hypothetical protein
LDKTVVDCANYAESKQLKSKKAKLSRIHHAGAKEEIYSSYSFSTSTLDGGEWLASRPGRALPPGKDLRYPFYRRLGGLLPTWT